MSDVTVLTDPILALSGVTGEGRPQKRPRMLSEGSDQKIRIYEAFKRPCIAKLLDGSVDVSWIRSDKVDERLVDGRSRLLASKKKKAPVIPQARFRDRPWPLDVRLPLPDVELLDKMEDEVRSLPREGDLGPLCSTWLEDEAEVFAFQMALSARGTRRRVQGLWQEHVSRWEWLLHALSKKRRERVLSMVRGQSLPWGRQKPMSLRCPRTGGCIG